ncbi:cation:proton antiporter [Dactylosporangium sp. NPDC005572]|uniref:cation:proton antiporter n=1 Tax=Dactylosporangium sp. NPDC005572 TaxID=3156889 RepID=UPI0033A3A15E
MSRTAWGVAAGLVVFAGAAALWGPDALSPRSGAPVDPLARFLLAVAVVLVVSHLFGHLLRRWGQPAVLGEILGGIVLGPSLLGLMWPGAVAWLFPAGVLDGLGKAAQLGLVVFMFLLGCELRLGRPEQDEAGAVRPRSVALVTVGGMGLPFLAGLGLAAAAGSRLSGTGGDGTAHRLFLGLALAVTALPVLARILVDLRLERTGVGALSLSAAAFGDAVAWLALTLIIAGAGGTADLTHTAGLAVALALVTLLCVRPALRLLVDRVESTQLLTVVLVAGAVTYAALTQLIHLHPLIGAFLFGVAVPRGRPAVERLAGQLQGFTLTILLPLFFAGVGLTTSIGLLGGDAGRWLLFAVICVAAQLTKFAGAAGAARLAGLPAREAAQVGVLMNCRGVTELVIASVGLQAGLVNEFGFTILVLIAVLTTAVTGPLTRRLMPGERRRVPAAPEERTAT